MRKMWVVIVIIFSTCGCASKMYVNNSTSIGTDANGYAVGQYCDSRSGEIQSPMSAWFGGGGGGGSSSSSGMGSFLRAALLGPAAAVSSAASSASSSGAGALGGGFSTSAIETQGDPLKFARAIAMINYSRRLDKITTEDAGGSREFTFTTKPLKQKKYGSSD